MAGIAPAAGEALGSGVVATVGQSVINPQLPPSEDDLLLGQFQQRRVEDEPAGPLDARLGRQVGQTLERVEDTRADNRGSPSNRRS